jgi:hypothetical protein
MIVWDVFWVVFPVKREGDFYLLRGLNIVSGEIKEKIVRVKDPALLEFLCLDFSDELEGWERVMA